MYARTSFRGAKTCKIGKKGMFLVILTTFGKDMTHKLRKSHEKSAYLGSIFIPEKYVFRVCFESPFTRMVSSLKYKWPPGLGHDCLRPLWPFDHVLNTMLCFLYFCFDVWHWNKVWYDMIIWYDMIWSLLIGILTTETGWWIRRPDF